MPYYPPPCTSQCNFIFNPLKKITVTSTNLGTSVKQSIEELLAASSADNFEWFEEVLYHCDCHRHTGTLNTSNVFIVRAQSGSGCTVINSNNEEPLSIAACAGFVTTQSELGTTYAVLGSIAVTSHDRLPDYPSVNRQKVTARRTDDPLRLSRLQNRPITCKFTSRENVILNMCNENRDNEMHVKYWATGYPHRSG